VARIQAHHNDAFSLSIPSKAVFISGDYAPDIPELCGGDDTRFDVCLDCGQMQGSWPKPELDCEKPKDEDDW
jgi:hypothetical protein